MGRPGSGSLSSSPSGRHPSTAAGPEGRTRRRRHASANQVAGVALPEVSGRCLRLAGGVCAPPAFSGGHGDHVRSPAPPGSAGYGADCHRPCRRRVLPEFAHRFGRHAMVVRTGSGSVRGAVRQCVRPSAREPAPVPPAVGLRHVPGCAGRRAAGRPGHWGTDGLEPPPRPLGVFTSLRRTAGGAAGARGVTAETQRPPAASMRLLTVVRTRDSGWHCPSSWGAREATDGLWSRGW